MGIYISPKNALLTGWSFYDYIPKPGVRYNHQETYFIYFSYGHNMDTDYHFHLDLLVCFLQKLFLKYFFNSFFLRLKIPMIRLQLILF